MKFIDKKIIEAKKELQDALEQINDARRRAEKKEQAYVDVIAEVFEREVVKYGEKITSASGEVYFYGGIRFDSYMPVVICYPVKKDGTQSKSVRYMFLSNFVELL